MPVFFIFNLYFSHKTDGFVRSLKQAGVWSPWHDVTILITLRHEVKKSGAKRQLPCASSHLWKRQSQITNTRVIQQELLFKGPSTFKIACMIILFVRFILFVRPTGVYLLDFFCSGIQFNLLLSPYPCFISLLYLDLYVLGDDALIS